MSSLDSSKVTTTESREVSIRLYTVLESAHKLPDNGEETHMKKLFSYVIKICKKYGIETSICGEGPSNNPELVEFLVHEGIDSLSVEIDALDKVKQQVAKLES